MLVKKGFIFPNRGENKTYLKPPPSLGEIFPSDFEVQEILGTPNNETPIPILLPCSNPLKNGKLIDL